MATDIQLAKPDSPIKNGTILIQCKVTGPKIKDLYNYYVNNKPVILDIQDKYDQRFDDPSYYYGAGEIDGGDV